MIGEEYQNETLQLISTPSNSNTEIRQKNKNKETKQDNEDNDNKEYNDDKEDDPINVIQYISDELLSKKNTNINTKAFINNINNNNSSLDDSLALENSFNYDSGDVAEGNGTGACAITCAGTVTRNDTVDPNELADMHEIPEIPDMNITYNVDIRKNHYDSDTEVFKFSDTANKLDNDINDLINTYKFEDHICLKQSRERYDIDNTNDLNIVESEEDSEEGKKPEIFVTDFQHIINLGKGGYGKVDLVKKKNTGEYYALKTVEIVYVSIFNSYNI